MSDVLVLAETSQEGVATKATLELLTAARALGEPAAVVVGPAGAPVLASLGEYGASRVYTVRMPEAAEYLSLPKAEALVDIARRANPVAVLVISSPEGKDTAAELAVRLDAGVVPDASAVWLDAGTVTAAQDVVAGRFRATSRVMRGPAVVTMRPGATAASPAPTTPAVEVVDVALAARARGARVVAREPKAATGRPELTDADVVVAGGRGVGSPDGFALIEKVADALGGAVGATRTATDQGWAPHDLQIGQTGKTIAPLLYVAAGISGAIQHRAGMRSSRTVVVVNKDPHAPLFSEADFGVVGDVHTVLPALLDEIARRQG